MSRNIKLFSLFVVAYLVKYFCNVFLARHFSPANYGDINIIIRMITVALPMIMLGADATPVRFLPSLIESEKAGAAVFLTWLFRIMAWACLAVFIFLFISGLLIYFSDHPSVVGHHYDVWLAALLLPLFILSAVFTKLLKSFGQYSFSIISSGILKYVFLIALLTIAFYIFNERNFYAVFAMLFVSEFLMVTVQLVVLLPKIIESFKVDRKIKPRPEWFKTALSYMLTNIVFVALTSIDMIALEILGRSEDEVGYFGALVVITNVLYLVSQTSALIVNTQTAKCYEKGDMQGVQKLASDAFIFNVIFGGFILLGVLVFGKSILLNFGSSYGHLYLQLVILSIGSFFISATQNASCILLYTDSQKEIGKINSLGLLAAIVLDVALIPFFGINGALFSVISVGVSLNLIKALRAKQILKIKPFVIF